MDKLTALLAGLLFGAGVTVSGMVNPMKVQNFMDILGRWDPTLLFVMGGALAVTYPGFRKVLRMAKPIASPRFFLPETKTIDLPLVAGAALFGAGWGIAGYCPGPAMTSMATLGWEPLLFVAMMGLGGMLHRLAFPARD